MRHTGPALSCSFLGWLLSPRRFWAEGGVVFVASITFSGCRPSDHSEIFGSPTPALDRQNRTRLVFPIPTYAALYSITTVLPNSQLKVTRVFGSLPVCRRLKPSFALGLKKLSERQSPLCVQAPTPSLRISQRVAALMPLRTLCVCASFHWCGSCPELILASEMERRRRRTPQV